MEVDNFLYNHLPNELYDLIRSLPDGINDSEAKNLIPDDDNDMHKLIA
ncbi:MAG: hypothetical protein JEZ09_08195 [Salinivirgaceae bacterium]|nr:hypothetical protein [Salinivirgaceae bacterium]